MIRKKKRKKTSKSKAEEFISFAFIFFAKFTTYIIGVNATNYSKEEIMDTIETRVDENVITTETEDAKGGFNIVDGVIIGGIALAGYGIGKGIEKVRDKIKNRPKKEKAEDDSEKKISLPRVGRRKHEESETDAESDANVEEAEVESKKK